MLKELMIFIISSMVLASHFAFTYATGVTRYWIRITLYFTTLFVVSLAAFPICLVMTALGRRFDTNWMQARLFYMCMTYLMGWECEVEGAEHLSTNPAIYIGNHQSAVDVLWIGKVMPDRCTIMAKKELKWVPVLGWWMSLAGTVWIDRGNAKNAMSSLDAAGDDIKQQSARTRTSFETPNMLPFKKGAFHLAVKAGVPIVPIVCENYWRLYRKGVFESGKLRIKVLPPISTTGKTAADVTDLAVQARELMLVALKDISVAVSDEVAAADNASLHKISSKRALPKTALVSPPASEKTASATIPVEKAPTTPQLGSSDHLAAPETSAGGSVGVHTGSPTGSSATTDDEWATVDRPPPT
ncbi:1-acylglycerol-3-phosphate O-acyltransferase [Tulasnella sp. 331]|nr:1-acylglycerol-3-phosphate O-acyltransferase [Tulasnella sp. 331]KAG8890506.1 1-acylglycerol-3-phosphate O-acyltransferase [Tulasnella sp. 332]